MTIGRLHVITDTRAGRDPRPVVTAALEAGAPVIQVRAKGMPDRELYELASWVTDACVAHDAKCIVNDRVDVALTTGAGGVHVGEHDLPITAVRRVIAADSLLGATARDATTARAHEQAGASYVGVGPCFSTPTKADLPDPLGPSGLRSVADAVAIPVIAIAGITAERVPELLDAGAHGVAVVSAVSEAADPHAAVEQLLRALEKAAG